MRANTIIIGAGLVGSAVAYELGRRGVKDVQVLDPDLEGSLSSSERNAGGVRHLWQQKVNQELSRVSISFFETIREEIGFQQTGYLWLVSTEKETSGKELLKKLQKQKLDYEALDLTELKSRYPFIDKTDGIAFALFGKKDGLINSNALKNYLRAEAKKHGVQFQDRQYVSSVSENGTIGTVKSVRVTTAELGQESLKTPEATPRGEDQVWEAPHIVIAAGAWSRELLKPLVGDPLVRPVRRQISFFKAENFDMSPYGMIIDTSGVYFHPEGGNILGGRGIKEEPEGYRFDYDSDFFENNIWPPLFERSTQLERLKFISGWGGLYSYSPDISGILGKLPGKNCIYEAHGFTGHGVMQSYGAGVAIADLITTGKYQTLDAAPLSRSRFLSGDKSQLMYEDLSI